MSSLRFSLFVLGLFLLIVSLVNFFVLLRGIGPGVIGEFLSAPSQSVDTSGTPATAAPAQSTATTTLLPAQPTATAAPAQPTATTILFPAAQPTGAVTQVTPEVPTGTPMPVPPMYTPQGDSQMRLWFHGTPVAPLGTHVVQCCEYLFCIGRAYGVLPQAIAEVNFLALDAPLFDGQPLQIPDVPWVNIPPGRICTPQFKSPYSPASVSMIIIPPSLLPGSRAILGSSRGGEDVSISGELRLINFVLPKEQVKKVGSQLVSLAVTPTQGLTEEKRIVRVKSPDYMNLGESDVISLTLDLPLPGEITESGTPPPTQPDSSTHGSCGVVYKILWFFGLDTNSVVSNILEFLGLGSNSCMTTVYSSNVLGIPDVFDNYDIFAIARLDTVGFTYSPMEADSQPVIKGAPITWHWSIKPLDVGQQELNISLRLQFKPKPNNVEPPKDRQIWIYPFTVNVQKPLFDGITGVITAIGGVITLITTSFPIWDRIIGKT